MVPCRALQKPSSTEAPGVFVLSPQVGPKLSGLINSVIDHSLSVSTNGFDCQTEF